MLTTRVIPTSEAASVGGIDVVAHPATAKQVIGVVPQTNTLDRALDVAENLYFHGRYFGMSARDAHERTAQLLEQFRLADRAQANVAELSGGMAQRLMVARAIMHDPDVLFLDEPTSGLDPQSRLALWDVIGELHAARSDHRADDALHGRSRPALRRASRSSTTASCSHSTRRRGLKHSIGADTEVASSASGDLEALRRRSSNCPASRAAASSTTRYSSIVKRGRPDPAGDHHTRRRSRIQRAGRRRDRNVARNRVHQPHRKGTPGMTAIPPSTPRVRSSPRNAFARVVAARPRGACAKRSGCSSAAR